MNRYVYEIEVYYAGWHKLDGLKGYVFSSQKKVDAALKRIKRGSYRDYRIVKKKVL